MKLKKANVSGLVTSPARLNALADGVFAIVMTLLVLELGVPVTQGISGNAELLQKLAGMRVELLIYALSFMILGVFWVVHHSIYAHVQRYDTTLVWLNIVFLMFISLVPFSTALVGKNGFITVTAVIYGSNILLLFNLGWATYAFITGKRRLVPESYDPRIIRGAKLMGLVYTLIIVTGIVIAFVNPKASFLIYVLLVSIFIMTTMLGKGELAMVVPVSSGSEKEGRSG